MDWNGKRVLITGHTGFKGGWLAMDLALRGAKMVGLAIEPATNPSLFQAARIESLIDSRIEDVRDFSSLLTVMREFRPEIVFHLAAQPLVRRSYAHPLETFETNVMGTANLLEAVRQVESTRVVLVVTTDKCYENREWHWGYREIDPLGGHDPYSASKAAAEIVAAAFRSSYFSADKIASHGVALATVRAGNVIGGGDWSEDRLIPDMVRAFSQGCPVNVRNPHAVRPWQHVLEPVEGYIELAERMWDDPVRFSSAWNFGPELADAIPVGEVVQTFASCWGGNATWRFDTAQHSHEAGLLRLDCSKAAAELGWRPRLHIKDALAMTADWYQNFLHASDMVEFSSKQIGGYLELRNHISKGLKEQ
jgi:CDP-glucose 4,6-dehydratase